LSGTSFSARVSRNASPARNVPHRNTVCRELAKACRSGSCTAAGSVLIALGEPSSACEFEVVEAAGGHEADDLGAEARGKDRSEHRHAHRAADRAEEGGGGRGRSDVARRG